MQLTDAGREAFDRMASAHASWVSDLLAGLEPAPAEQLSQLLHDARLAIRTSAGAVP